MKKIVIIGVLIFLIALAFSISYTDIIQQNIQRIESSTPISSSSISIIAFGDTKDGVQILKDLINDVNHEKYDFVIYTGDSVPYGNKELFEDFAKDMSKLSKPYITVIGNHEYYNDYGEDYFKIYGKNDYSFVYKNVAIVSFDDANPNSWRIDWKWLKNEIKKYDNNPEIKMILLTMHIPPIDPRPNGSHCLNPFYQSKLLNIINGSKVKLIVSGHIHLYWYGNWKGIKVLITGGAGAPLYAGPKNGGFYHYTIINISNNGNFNVILKKLN